MKRLTGLEALKAMKAKHPDALLLFRVGNFYEAYRDDAKDAADILALTLIRRHTNGEDYFMAGFPRHELDKYLPKLVRAGKRVAICEDIDGQQPDDKPQPQKPRTAAELRTAAPEKFQQLTFNF